MLTQQIRCEYTLFQRIIFIFYRNQLGSVEKFLFSAVFLCELETFHSGNDLRRISKKKQKEGKKRSPEDTKRYRSDLGTKLVLFYVTPKIKQQKRKIYLL